MPRTFHPARRRARVARGVELAERGLPTAVLEADRFEGVRLSANGSWHVDRDGCPKVKDSSRTGERRTVTRLDRLCPACTPDVSAAQDRFLRAAGQVLDLDDRERWTIEPTWNDVLEAEDGLDRVRNVRDRLAAAAASHPEGTGLTDLVTHVETLLASRVAEISAARAEAPEPAATLFVERVAQAFTEDRTAWVQASRLCRTVASFQLPGSPAGRSSAPEELLATAAGAWAADPGVDLPAFVAGLFTDAVVVDVRELTGPARTPSAGHTSVAAWALAELVALAAELAGQWPARLAAAAALVGAETGETLVRVTPWRPTSWSGLAHLARYPVLARARRVDPEYERDETAVLRVPALVAEHAARVARGQRGTEVVLAPATTPGAGSGPEDAPGPETFTAAAEALLAGVAFVPGQCWQAAPEPVLRLRTQARETGFVGASPRSLRGHRLWIPVTDEHGALTPASARELNRHLEELDGLHVLLDGSPARSVRDTVEVSGWRAQLSADGRELRTDDGTWVPVSRLVAASYWRD